MEVFARIDESSRILIGTLDYDEPRVVSVGKKSLSTDLYEYCKIISDDFEISALPEEYNRIAKILRVHDQNKVMIVPKKKLQDHFENVLSGLQDVVCVPSNLKYLVNYISIREFLCGLSRASVDRQKLARLIQQNDNLTIKSNLRSLESKSGDLAPPVNYSMASTNTGRLVVKDGPKILTIPASCRAVIKSRFKGGKILQIDLVSAEPKFALHQAGVEVPADVYSYIAREILDDTVSRKSAKLITLCALYGQSLKKLSKQLPDSIGARAVVRKTKEYFRYDMLISKLKSDFNKGDLRSIMGRPLRVDSDSSHMLISHYLQSSVAEGSIVMFSNLIESLGPKCLPLFVIHDALIVDADQETADMLLSSIKIPLFLDNYKFDATVTCVGE